MRNLSREGRWLVLAGGVLYSAIALGEDASGTLAYKARSATLRYAWFVRGPLPDSSRIDDPQQCACLGDIERHEIFDLMPPQRVQTVR